LHESLGFKVGHSLYRIEGKKGRDCKPSCAFVSLW